jgi:hypothetical protein
MERFGWTLEYARSVDFELARRILEMCSARDAARSHVAKRQLGG